MSRKLRKQLKLISSLSQTILTHRINFSPTLAARIASIRKKIKKMIQQNFYEDGIAEQLAAVDNYQIKNKILNFLGTQSSSQTNTLNIELQLKCVQKQNCQKYNDEFWQFSLKTVQNPGSIEEKNTEQSNVQLIQFILRHLTCYNLLPLGQQNRNKFMVDYKLSISNQQRSQTMLSFGNLTSRRYLIPSVSEKAYVVIEVKYFFNDQKIQQSLKSKVLEKISPKITLKEKKNSAETSDSLSKKRVSFYEYYDQQLDITVLSSSSDFSSDGDQVSVSVEQQDEFQLLIEETQSEDRLFLKQNKLLLSELNSLEDEYIF